MEWEKQLTVSSAETGLTIKEYLTQLRIPHRIRGNLRQERRVLLNGAYAPTSTAVKENDEITLRFIESDFVTPSSNYLPDNSRRVEILFENDDLIVANKWAGVKTHPTSPDEMGTMMNYAQAYLRKNDANQSAYMVHRLDGATTGALIIAKNPVVVPMLDQMLQTKEIQRTYLAWVAGSFDAQNGVIDLPIGDHPTNRRLRQVNGENAQTAVTHWRVVHQVTNFTLLRLQLETGRTHQLRVHLASIGHPIVGDQLYNPQQYDQYGLLLHAINLRLPIPFTKETRMIAAPLPAGFPRNLKID